MGLVDAEIDPVAGEVPDVPLPGETPSDTDTLADARKEVAS